MAELDVNRFLEQLGLTEYEAKTLNALFKLNEAEAPETSRVAQVPKTRVYDVLDRLAKRGLIIGIHGRPKRYRAIGPSAVFKTLINEKKDQLKELEAKAEELGNSIEREDKAEVSEKVMKVKDRGDFVRILGQEIDTAKSSVIVFAPLAKEHSLLKNSIKNAIGKNIEIRLIGAIGEEAKRLAKEYSELGVNVKDLEHGMHAYILDNKKVILGLSDFTKDSPEYHFAIWPENKAMVDALQGYFNQMWKKAK